MTKANCNQILETHARVPQELLKHVLVFTVLLHLFIMWRDQKGQLPSWLEQHVLR